jgi:hypothetical protein
MAVEHLPKFILENYEIHEWKHASAILESDFPQEWQDIIEVLSGFRLLKSHVIIGGGNKSPVANALDNAFFSEGMARKRL